MTVDTKQLAAELAKCGNALLALAAAMTGEKSETAVPAEQSKPVEAIPLEKVRSVLADKSRLSHTAEVKALLQKHGAMKLSEMDPAEYAALLAEAEVLK